MRPFKASARVAALSLIAIATLYPAPSFAAVTDVTIAGRLLKLRASQSNPARRSLTYRSAVDDAIAPPFADPASGASLLVFASNASGECRIEAELPAANWKAIGNDGPNRGWRYRDPTGAVAGIRRVEIRNLPKGGRIVVKARAENLPCGLEAASQSLPIAVVLRLGDTRYCASFDSTSRNETGKLDSHDALPPAACPDDDFTVANLNVLHGLACPGPTDKCRLPERIDLLGQWIVERGCPDAVALQEVFDLGGIPGSLVTLIQGTLLDVCPFTYEVAYLKLNTIDDSLVLSRHPVLFSQALILHGNFRNVLHVQIDHPIGAVDLFSTHLASGSDLGPSPCNVQLPCPQECIDAGAVTVRDCQAVQLAAFASVQHEGDAPAVIVGDFNAEPSSFVYDQMINAGWTDTFLAAWNPECVAATGIGCTSGREDSDLTDLESSALSVDERIDYVFLVPPGPDSTCSGTLDSPTDGDGDGIATRLFADEPNPFSITCGASPDPICWVSDHTGVQADVNCG